MSEPPSQNTWSGAEPTSFVAQSLPTTFGDRNPSKAVRFVYGAVGTGAAAFVTFVSLYIGAMAKTPRVATPPRPPALLQNGFPLLKAATDKPVHSEDVKDALSASPKKHWTLAQKRKLVAANSAGIRATRDALRFPYREENRAVSMKDEFYYYGKFRSMVETLVLAGNVAWEEGRESQAAGDYLDAVTIGRRIPNRTFLIARSVGITCEAIGRRAIWNRLERMNDATTARCLDRLQTLQAERLPFSVTLEEEKYTCTKLALEGMADPDTLILPSGKGNTLTDTDRDGRRILQVYRRVVPRKYVVDELEKHMNTLIAQSKEPYISGNREIPRPKEVYSYILIPEVHKVRFRYVYNEAADALLRTTLALRVYHARNGRYPLALSELVTANILAGVPDDPFDVPGTALRYRRLPSGKYSLYSIGPDGINDGGKGVDDPGNGKESARNVEISSTGDMVVGWHPY